MTPDDSTSSTRVSIDIVAFFKAHHSRVTANTAGAEEDYHNDIDRDENVRIADSEVNTMIGAVNERFQVLLHAYVYGFSTVVLAVGDPKHKSYKAPSLNSAWIQKQPIGKC
eukprot:scaffold266166_cov63-Attheya_sp.AAC.3